MIQEHASESSYSILARTKERIGLEKSNTSSCEAYLTIEEKVNDRVVADAAFGE